MFISSLDLSRLLLYFIGLLLLMLHSDLRRRKESGGIERGLIFMAISLFAEGCSLSFDGKRRGGQCRHSCWHFLFQICQKLCQKAT